MNNVISIVFTIKDTSKLMISFIPVGFIASAIPLIIGLAISGIVKIFKQV